MTVVPLKQTAYCTACGTEHAHNVGCLTAIQQRLLSVSMDNADLHSVLVKAKVLLEHDAVEQALELIRKALSND